MKWGRVPSFKSARVGGGAKSFKWGYLAIIYVHIWWCILLIPRSESKTRPTMGFTNVGLLALAGKNLPVLVSKNQTKKPGLIFGTRTWFFKRTRFPILLKCGSLEPENKLEVCQKQAFVWDFCGKVQQLLRVRMHSLNQFCLWEAMLVWLGLGETHETHVPIMLYEIFFSYTVCSYWLLKSFFFIIFLHFWFLNFWFFFRGKKSTNLWVIRFNFCLKKRCYVFFSMASNLVVDNATHHKKKESTRHKKNLHSHVSILHMRLLKKLRLKKWHWFPFKFQSPW